MYSIGKCFSSDFHPRNTDASHLIPATCCMGDLSAVSSQACILLTESWKRHKKPCLRRAAAHQHVGESIPGFPSPSTACLVGCPGAFAPAVAYLELPPPPTFFLFTCSSCLSWAVSSGSLFSQMTVWCDGHSVLCRMSACDFCILAFSLSH